MAWMKFYFLIHGYAIVLESVSKRFSTALLLHVCQESNFKITYLLLLTLIPHASDD